MIAVVLVYAEDETCDSQFSLGSKECRRAEMKRRSDVEVVSPNTKYVSSGRKGNDGDVVGIKNPRGPKQKGVTGRCTIKYEEPLRHRKGGCRKPKKKRSRKRHLVGAAGFMVVDPLNGQTSNPCRDARPKASVLYPRRTKNAEL